MDLSTFIVTVFCLTDDWLEGQENLRQRGPKPKLSDSEVLTMEIVGRWSRAASRNPCSSYGSGRARRRCASPPMASARR